MNVEDIQNPQFLVAIKDPFPRYRPVLPASINVSSKCLVLSKRRVYHLARTVIEGVIVKSGAKKACLGVVASRSASELEASTLAESLGPRRTTPLGLRPLLQWHNFSSKFSGGAHGHYAMNRSVQRDKRPDWPLQEPINPVNTCLSIIRLQHHKPTPRHLLFPHRGPEFVVMTGGIGDLTRLSHSHRRLTFLVV